MAYVAYMDRKDAKAGEPVDQSKYDDETWADMIAKGIIVVQGSENDPKVLAARASGEGYEDPRDQRIAELEAQVTDLQASAKPTKQEEQKSPTPTPEQKQS
jgi:hypothetical protein